VGKSSTAVQWQLHSQWHRENSIGSAVVVSNIIKKIKKHLKAIINQHEWY